MGNISIQTFESPGEDTAGKVSRPIIAYIEEKLGAKKASYTALAHIDGEFAGGVNFWHYGPDARIQQLFVEEKFRGQGVGQKLVSVAEKTAAQKQCRQITVDTATFESPDFYRHIGYEHIGTIKDIFLGHDRLTFRRLLPTAK